MKVNKNNLNITQIFIVFTTLVGDVQRTAAALDLDPAVVQKLADDELWHEKISRISLLSNSGKPGEYAKATNRALNFATAHRLRLVLDKVIEEFDGLTPEEVIEKISTKTAAGATSISSRFFSDLASAVEKVSHLSYAALADTVAERPSQDEEEGVISASQMHLAVLQALNNPAMRNVPEKLLKDEQVSVAANPKQVTHDTHVDERISLAGEGEKVQ